MLRAMYPPPRRPAPAGPPAALVAASARRAAPLRHHRLAIRQRRACKLADFAHARDLHELASSNAACCPEAQRLALLALTRAGRPSASVPFNSMLDDYAFELSGADLFQIISGWELRTYMADTLLRDSDVFSMAHSLELRVPFVDRVLEGSGPSPRGSSTTRAASSAPSPTPPPTFVPAAAHRPKQGFALPFARWMLAELRPSWRRPSHQPRSLLPSEPTPARSRACRQNYTTQKDPRAWSRV